jgi:hypothetical protein
MSVTSTSKILCRLQKRSILGYTYRVAQKLLKYSFVLTEIFRSKPASQLVEQYHGVVGCPLNLEGLISDIFCVLRHV